jgi:hypothetical protein
MNNILNYTIAFSTNQNPIYATSEEAGDIISQVRSGRPLILIRDGLHRLSAISQVTRDEALGEWYSLAKAGLLPASFKEPHKDFTDYPTSKDFDALRRFYQVNKEQLRAVQTPYEDSLDDLIEYYYPEAK